MTTTSPTSPSRSARLRLEGRVLGRYRLLTHIANGGMASVHVARAEGTFGFERLVAVKLLHPHLANETEFVAMIADEARMAARIRHPKVVSVLDVDEDPELGLYLVMEYVDGDHLGNIVQELRAIGERLPPRIAVRIMLDLLEGLSAAHELVDGRGARTPIIHRDVSPHNVLVGTDGIARLADFGVAHAESRITHTGEGRFKGKLAYMAPEQLSDGVVDPRVDIFAAGALLHEALTGRRLFRGDSTAETLKRLLHDPIPRIDEHAPELAPLADIVATALARDPDQRFGSATVMARALAEVASANDGIAEPREVGELVRATRGAMIAERAARIRLLAEVVPAHSDVTTVMRTSSSFGDRTPSNARMSRREGTASHTRSDVTQPPPRRRVLGRGPIVAALATLVACVTVALVVRRADPAPRGAGSASAAPASTPAVAIEDGPPVLEHHVDPGISADRAQVVPTVVLRVKVGADGSVLDSQPYQPRPDREELDRIAVAASREYRFRPAMRGGVAVEAYVNLPVRFRRVRGADQVVRIKGSDTIGASLAPALAYGFRAMRPDIDVTIESLGSSTAFGGIFDGTADLGTSSRPIAAGETEEATRLGLFLEETVIAYDGIAVVVHPDNPITSLSLDQLASIFSGRSASFSDVGGEAVPIHLLGRPSYSGTHGFFESRVLGPRSVGFARSVREIERSEDLVEAVANDPSAIAYVGTASLDRSVRVLALVAGTTAVMPTESTIRDGSYPIARPLLVYSRGTPSRAAASFLQFVLSPVGRNLVRDAGFVPSESVLELDASGTAESEGGSAVELARRIQFAGTGVALPSGSQPIIEEVARLASAMPSARIAITGHADTERTEAANVELGRARALAIAEVLHRLHVERDRIVVDSRGSSAPIASNRDAVGRARNRRVDLVVLDAPR